MAHVLSGAVETAPLDIPDEIADDDEAVFSSSDRWMTIIFNNDHVLYQSVLMAVMVATQCSLEEAEIEVWEAHHHGSAAIHFASKEECEKVAKIINAIDVKTEVRREWSDS